jgi:predicted DNA-binding transcriptional regulator AlpA
MIATLDELATWAASAPAGTLVPVEHLRECLAVRSHEALEAASASPALVTWRERLWTVPAETRLGVRELGEALGRPRSWVYRHSSKRSGLALLPFRKLDGELVFLAGEIRTWITRNEVTVVQGAMPLRLIEQRRGA